MHRAPNRITMHSQHNAGALLDQAEDIGSLMPKARHLLELRRSVLQLLPEPLSRSCTVANTRTGKLVIFAENGAVAAKLKLLAPALRVRLSEAGEQVTSVVIEVQPPARRAREQMPRPPISTRAAADIEELCSRISDPRLKEILRTLASRAKPGD